MTLSKTSELPITRKESKKGKNVKTTKDILLNPAGDIIPEDNLIYEPIGNNQYIYNKSGNKGKATASPDTDNRKKFWINFDEEIYYFKGKPLSSLLFYVPSEEIIDDYLEDTYPVKKGKKIVKELIDYFKITTDLLKPYHYYNLVIGSLQSWALPILSSVFYVGFEAKFGSGKSKALEGLTTVCKHGYMVGDITSSGTARITHSQGLSLSGDEIDVATGGKDNELYRIYRQGYRRGSPYVRLKERSYEPEVFNIFGFKAFTFAKDVERALLQRTLVTPMRKTDDKKLPLICMYIDSLGRELYEDLFFWYMENGVNLFTFLPFLPYLRAIPQKTIQEKRKEIYKQITKNLSENEIQFLDKYSGRNIELGFNVIILSKIFGYNLMEEIKSSFEEKEDIESVSADSKLQEFMMESLREIYSSNNFCLEKGVFANCFYYPINDFYDDFRRKLREKDYYMVGQSRFKEFLKEIGFQFHINIKRQKFQDRNVLCLIYDDSILKQLDLEVKNQSSEEEVKND